MKYSVNTNNFKTESEALQYAHKLAMDAGHEVTVYVKAPYLRSITGNKSIDFSIFLEKVACDELSDPEAITELKKLVNDPFIWSIYDHFEVHPDGTITQETPFDDPYLFEDTLYYPDH